LKLWSRTAEGEQKNGMVVIKYGGVISSADKRKPLFFCFYFWSWSLWLWDCRIYPKCVF